MKRLEALLGGWKGHGSGGYPTIEAFEYDETLRFELNSSDPLMHYEQRTWRTPSGEALHWESGFILPTEDGAFEISNSQNSGRVEVLRGRIDESSDADLHIVFDNVVLDHDPRMVQSRRIWTLRGDVLRYEVHMATRTTPAPLLQRHLQAELRRH